MWSAKRRNVLQSLTYCLSPHTYHINTALLCGSHGGSVLLCGSCAASLVTDGRLALVWLDKREGSLVVSGWALVSSAALTTVVADMSYTSRLICSARRNRKCSPGAQDQSGVRSCQLLPQHANEMHLKLYKTIEAPPLRLVKK